MKPFDAVAIGGSAGSFKLVLNLLEVLSQNGGVSLPTLIALHRSRSLNTGMLEAFSRKCAHICEPTDKEPVKKGQVYLAPANYHMGVEPEKSIFLSTEVAYHYSRPALDILFDSASFAYQNRLLTIVLSGANQDGSWGAAQVTKRGGTVVVQDPEEAVISTMPDCALKACQTDYVLGMAEIKELLVNINQK